MLQDIPVGGYDQWFELVNGKKGRKAGVTGHVRLKLQLSAKQVKVAAHIWVEYVVIAGREERCIE